MAGLPQIQSQLWCVDRKHCLANPVVKTLFAAIVQQAVHTGLGDVEHPAVAALMGVATWPRFPPIVIRALR